ncbi:MAG: hypothetical protein HDR51_04595 [Treponema sp.]|nr:hypothetical protein [Treponema sp.]
MLHCKLTCNVGKSFLLQLFLLLLFISCESETECVYKDSISVKFMPDKTEYFIGEKISYEGLVVVAVKENGESVEITDYEIVPQANIILSEKGKQNVIIKYKERELGFSINVVEITDSLLYLRQIPKCAYYEGEKLDLSELVLEILKTDGSKETVTEFTAEPADGTVLEKNESGKIKITVKHGELYTSFDAFVYDKEADYIRIKKMPSKTNYYINDILDLSGMIVEAFFNDGTIKEISDYTVSEISKSLSHIGSKTVKISWLDKETEFNVTVKNLPIYFTEQPLSRNFKLYSDEQTLSCAVAVLDDAGSLQFLWYGKNPNEESYTEIYKSKSQNVENSKTYAATVTLPKNNYIKAQYYCEAIFTKDGITKTAVSNVAEVEQIVNTELAVVEINTPNHQGITSKEEWMADTSFSLSHESNSKWNLENVNANIRGRGNSTWAQPKKPYALKFGKKTGVFDFPKHKRWVLIANYLDNSFMRNSMAFYFSDCFEMDYTVRGDFVSLVLNGQYNGLYWLGEAIKADENRVDINEDDDYLIELDVYYDEAWKFKSEIKKMPYMIKNDDKMTNERLKNLEDNINKLESLLYPNLQDETEASAPDESYAEMLDIASWAKFWIINELMSNGELHHPKSCYFTFDNTNKILKAGPVWDFDWASLSKPNSTSLKNTIYFDALFKSSAFIKKVKEIWDTYSVKICIDEQIETLRAQIYKEQINDEKRWGRHADPSGIPRENFDAYVDFLKETLNEKFEIVKNEIESLE